MFSIKLLQLALTLSITLSGEPDIYSYKVNALAQKDPINLKEFRGKKILIVNTALASIYADQMSSLDSLARKYKNNLVVIAFPTNSFGNESEDEKNISRIIDQRYKVHFYLAEKVSVKGKETHPLYQWLTQKKLNGVMDSEMKTDFQKFLIDEEGNMVGIFSAVTEPMSRTIQETIITNFKN